MSEDPYITALVTEIIELRRLLRKHSTRTWAARKARDVWKARAYAAERQALNPYAKRRIRFLEDQLLSLNAERREANREGDFASRSGRESAAA